MYLFLRRTIGRLLKASLNTLGFALVRLPGNDRGFIPYVCEKRRPCASFNFWVSDPTAREWYDKGDNRLEEDELYALALPGDRVLEIGCNHGYFTLVLCGRVSPNGGFVLGVEAHPRNVLVAQANVTLNALRPDQCAIVNFAGTAVDGERIPIRDEINSSVAMNSAETKNTLEVESITGDSLDRQFGPFNFLKMDIEGFEAVALHGCKNLLERRPKLAIELHLDVLKARGHSMPEIARVLHLEDYEGRVICKDSDTSNPRMIDYAASTFPTSGYANIFLRAKTRPHR